MWNVVHVRAMRSADDQKNAGTYNTRAASNLNVCGKQVII
jgi:hypothetical protein